jgi:hypothetical protein
VRVQCDGPRFSSPNVEVTVLECRDEPQEGVPNVRNITPQPASERSCADGDGLGIVLVTREATSNIVKQDASEREASVGIKVLAVLTPYLIYPKLKRVGEALSNRVVRCEHRGLLLLVVV